MDDDDLDFDVDNDEDDDDHEADGHDRERSVDFGQWPEFFVTRIIGADDLPDVEILTLPAYRWPDEIPDLGRLQPC